MSCKGPEGEIVDIDVDVCEQVADISLDSIDFIVVIPVWLKSFCLQGIKIPIYQLRARDAKKIGSDGGTTWNAEEEQSILDSLLLAQWEDRAWKGLLRYDVTACETRVISGGRKFIAQLSKEWKSKCVPNLEEFKTLQQVDLFKFNCMKTLNEELLFCVASGAKAKSELITSSAMPNDANLVIINANPVEYGHVFFVPINFHLQDQTLDSRSLELVTVVSSEINNCSFCVFYDCPSTRSGCYFANHLPVEFAQFVPIAGVWQERGIQICEVADYPVKALLFSSSHNSKALVDAVSEICSYLQDQSIPFNLLISDCGMKIFLFPKVMLLQMLPTLSFCLVYDFGQGLKLSAIMLELEQ
ncbi:hypothetical protein ACLOJK_021721 [Asimina triloba]